MGERKKKVSWLFPLVVLMGTERRKVQEKSKQKGKKGE
jgi:hypothetical protein